MEVVERLLDVRAVAAQLSVSSRQVFKLAAMGKIPGALKLNRSTRWRESDILRFIEAGCDMVVFAAMNE